MSKLIPSHGGIVVNRMAKVAKTTLADYQTNVPSITLNAWNITDLKLIANGAYSPSHLITLSVDEDTARELILGEKALLKDEEESPLGLIEVEDIYT